MILKKHPIHSAFLIMGILSLSFKLFTSNFSKFTETIYSRGIFLIIRNFLDFTIGLLPFSFIYIILIITVLWLIVKLSKRTKSNDKTRNNWLPLAGRLLFHSLSYLGLTVFVFFFFWGYNYDRVPIENHLNLTLKPLNANMIKIQTEKTFENLIKTRNQISGATEKPLTLKFLPKDIEYLLRKSFKTILKKLDYPAPGKIRLRKFYPGGILMNFGIAGFYFPFTGEAHLPHKLTTSEIPFSAAHEMAHAYGFAREGTANLIALLVCLNSETPVIKYSGLLGYFRYIGSEFYRVSAEEYKEMYLRLPVGIRADRWQTIKNWQKHQSWLRKVGDKVNNIYLKSQGVKEGILSYNRLLVLYSAYQNRTNK